MGQAVVLNANFELRPPGAEPRVAVAEVPAPAADAVLNLGTFQSQAGAEIGWVLLQRQYAVALAGLVRIDDPASAAGAGTVLLAGPLRADAAAQVCAQLAAQGQFCAVSRPPAPPLG